MPGYPSMLKMTGLLIGESVPEDASVLVVGAGGGLELRHLAIQAPRWRFVGVDPAPTMLELARDHAAAAGDRLTLIEGTVDAAPDGPFDAATCILVLGLIADDGSKATTLAGIRRRLKPAAPFVLVDHCLDRSAVDFELRLDRYAGYALANGVDAQIVAAARAAISVNPCMVAPERNERLLAQAGFREVEVFYVGMAWRGWISRA